MVTPLTVPVAERFEVGVMATPDEELLESVCTEVTPPFSATELVVVEPLPTTDERVSASVPVIVILPDVVPMVLIPPPTIVRAPV
jgi:hypothetical protein